MVAIPKPSRSKVKREKRVVVVEACPYEDSEQHTVVAWLTVHGILFHASPNGGFRHPVTAMRMKKLGASPGFPDIMIFDRPGFILNGLLYVGAAIEMKRRTGGTVSEFQKGWIKALTDRGWAVTVAKGADEAIEWLESIGYGNR